MYKNIQFSLEAIDLDEEIRNEHVKEDGVLSEEKISCFDFFIISFLFIFPNLIPILNLEHPSFHFLSY